MGRQRPHLRQAVPGQDRRRMCTAYGGGGPAAVGHDGQVQALFSACGRARHDPRREAQAIAIAADRRSELLRTCRRSSKAGSTSHRTGSAPRSRQDSPESWPRWTTATTSILHGIRRARKISSKARGVAAPGRGPRIHQGRERAAAGGDPRLQHRATIDSRARRRFFDCSRSILLMEHDLFRKRHPFSGSCSIASLGAGAFFKTVCATELITRSPPGPGRSEAGAPSQASDRELDVAASVDP